MQHYLHHPTPGEIRRRILGLQREMTSRRIHGVLITQRIDLLYFSGCAQNAYLYVPQKDGPILLVRKHLPRAALDSPLSLHASLESIRDIPNIIMAHGLSMPKVLGMAWDATPVREFRFFRELFRSRAHVDVTNIIHDIRSIKSPWEIERISCSSRICEMTLDHLRSCLHPGMTETHLSGLSEAFARRLGHGGGIRVRHPSLDDRSAWLAGGLGSVPGKGPFSVGFRSVVNGYHAARARIYGMESGAGSERRAADSLESFHETMLSETATWASLEKSAEAARSTASETEQGDPALNCRWTIQGIGLELHEPFKPGADPARFREGGMCIVLDSRMRTLKGRALCIQDTLVMDAEGVRLV